MPSLTTSIRSRPLLQTSRAIPMSRPLRQLTSIDNPLKSCSRASCASRELVYDFVKKEFSDDIPAIEPTNLFLVSALISGACIRSGICNSSTQSGMITLGLRFGDELWREMIPDEKAEVWAIHAALHLLAGGRRIYREEQIGYRQKELLPALKAIAEQNIIINPRGKALF